MPTSRRRFLKTGSMVAFSAGIATCLGNKALANITDLAAPISRSAYSKSEFEACLNSNFYLQGENGPVTLKLSKIADLRRAARKGRTSRETFSLLFQGPAGINQETYTVENLRLGRFSLLLVPVVTKKNRGRSYEAIINRL